MSLVDYSSSSSDEEGAPSSLPSASVSKRRNTASNKGGNASAAMPSLPASFLDLYATNVRTGLVDDPGLHGGRKRAIPHIEGNWPTHVYLEWWPTDAERKMLHGLIEKARQGSLSDHQLHSHLNSDLGTALPLHISLSRPIVLVADNKDAFAEQLSKELSDLNVSRFRVVPKTLGWVSNWESTRWFLVLKLNRTDDDVLNQLLHVTNRVVARFGQPKLYDNTAVSGTKSRKQSAALSNDFTDCFHISIAWSIEEPKSDSGSDIDGGPMERLSIEFDSIKLKIGNGIFSVPLKSSTLGFRGFGDA